MESFGTLEVKTEINTNPIKEELNVDNNGVENMKALTDLQQHASEWKTECSLGTEHSLDNHFRSEPEQDNWRSHNPLVRNGQESIINCDELEEGREISTFYLNPSSSNEDAPPEFEKVFVHDIHLDVDVSAAKDEQDEQMSCYEQPGIGQEPQPVCSFWSDEVDHQRGRDLDFSTVNSEELAEDHLGACDPLVTNETSSLKILKSHMMKEHSHKKPFHCKFCDYKCSFRCNLKEHERKHTGEKPFHCKLCDYKCAKRFNLKQHEKTHIGEKSFHCEFCDYKCTQSSNLKIHERTHTGEKPFNCKFCDYECSRLAYLRLHERTHTGEKPFSCKFCDYKCSQSVHLKGHERTHTGEKPFHCKLCDYECSHLSSLRIHERTHTGEKPFFCEFCDYKCSTSSKLKTHAKIHTGEKPFHCKFCDYKCYTSSNLKVHERTHTGEKPFNCKFCDYKCTQRSRLKEHERTHTGE